MPGTLSNCHIRVYLGVIYGYLCYLLPRSEPSAGRNSLCVLRQIPYNTFMLAERCLICRDTEHHWAEIFQSGCWLGVIHFWPLWSAWFPDTLKPSGRTEMMPLPSFSPRTSWWQQICTVLKGNPLQAPSPIVEKRQWQQEEREDFILSTLFILSIP